MVTSGLWGPNTFSLYVLGEGARWVGLPAGSVQTTQVLAGLSGRGRPVWIGSIEAFASVMNETAAALGLENTHFENSTGLPAENHYSSAKDMAKIYGLVCENALYKKYSKIWGRMLLRILL